MYAFISHMAGAGFNPQLVASEHRPHGPILIPIADENDVMREQLENLIAATTNHSPVCPCSECHRYARVKAILFEVFVEPARV